MTLTTRTIRNMGWSGISQIIRIFGQFIIIAILARLLTPKDFGLIAMVVVFTEFLRLFRDFGLSAALIQRGKLTEKHLSSMFWINILTGFILTLILSACAPIIANFYNEDRLILITIILASTFFISSFGIVQNALFMKELNHKYIAIIWTFTTIISGALAIVLAFTGFGIWSLVYQQVISSLILGFLPWFFCRWKPKFLFSWREVKELLGFGLNLTGFNFVNYFSRNLDNLFIGKFLGSISLGFYNFAYQVMMFPLDNISFTIGEVMFPSLSIIKKDKNKVRYAYLKATRYIAVITFPLMIGLLALAPQFVRVFFGPQWERSIFIIQIFAIIGLIQSIETTTGWIFQSQGHTRIMLWWGIFSSVISTAAFFIGLRWDIEGVATAYAITVLLLMYPCFFIAFRLIDLKFGNFIKQFKFIFLASTIMGGIIFGFRIFLDNFTEVNDLIILISTVALGMIIYLGLLLILEKALYKETVQLLRNNLFQKMI